MGFGGKESRLIKESNMVPELETEEISMKEEGRRIPRSVSEYSTSIW
jgi:hypothetical protein